MNTKMKRFLSVVLTVVMVIALLPANAMSVFAVAPEEVAVSAKLTRKTVENSYVNTLAIGETADLIVAVDGTVLTDLSEVTVTSSNSDILDVIDGQLVGVHSGEAQVTATYNGVTSEPFAVTVVKESVYNFATSVFNIGNEGHFLDTNSYNGVINSYLSRWNLYNTWTDTSASKFIPFYVTSNTSDAEYVGDDGVITATPTGTNNGYVYLRMREDAWKLYPIWTDGRTNGNTLMTENEKYLNTYDYQNPWHTDSWQFTSLNYGINGAATYLKQFDKLYITTTLGFDDASANARYTPYIIFKLKVPAAGTYTVNVDAGSTSATGAYYTVYAASSNTALGDIMMDVNKLGRLDTTAVSSGLMENTFVAEEAGEYYFAFYFGVDGVNGPGNANKKFSTTLKSITLTLDEVSGPVLSAEKNKLVLGQETTLKVTQNSSASGEILLTNVEYAADDEGQIIALTKQADGTAKITALRDGRVKVTASFDYEGKPQTDEIYIIVSKELRYNTNLHAFNVGVIKDNVLYRGDNLTTLFGTSSKENTWTDEDAQHVIPFYVVKGNQYYYPTVNPTAVTTVANSSIDWSQMVLCNKNDWYLRFDTGAGCAEIRSYIENTDYLYLSSHSANWRWENCADSNLKTTACFIYEDFMRLTAKDNSFAAGSEPYYVLVLDVPAAGKYKIDVSAASGLNQYVYMLPCGEGFNRTEAFTQDNLLGCIEAGERQASFIDVEIEAPGEYYFAVMLMNDNDMSLTGGFCDLYSIDLTLDRLDHIAVTPSGARLEVGETLDLVAKEVWTVSGEKAPSQNVQFTSKDPTIADVDASGKVTAHGMGDTEIVVTMGDLVTKVAISVTEDILTAVELEIGEEEWEVGEGAQLAFNETWTVSGSVLGNGKDYTFVSSNSNIATVDSKGVVTGIAPGKVTITAKSKTNSQVFDTIDLVILRAQSTSETFEIKYLLGSSAYNIGNDTNGDGIVDDFGDNNGIVSYLPEDMFNTWTNKGASFFIPFYATDSADANSSNTQASVNGYAWARVREDNWRLFPIWKNTGYAANEEYFTQYRYQNGDRTGYWQWTEYNEGINVNQTYLLTNNVFIRSSSVQIEDGNEPFVTLKLKVSRPGYYHFATEGYTGNANLHFYMVPVKDVEQPSRETLILEKYYIGNLNQREELYKRYDKAINVEEAGEYYLVIVKDNDNWLENETGYPTEASGWDTRLQSITLILDKQTGISAETNKTEIRVGGTAKLTVCEKWQAEGSKLIQRPSTRGIVFTSSNEKVVKVDADGKITGVGGGTATITVTQGEFKQAVVIKVAANATVKKINLLAPRSVLNIARSLTLSVEEVWSVGGAEVLEDVAGKITFTTSDASVAKVDANGKVTGVGMGKVTITATHKATGKQGIVEIQVDGVLTYNILTSSFNIANYNENTGTYDFGDVYTDEPYFTWFESKKMYNTWTDQNATKFIPFYGTDATDQNITVSGASGNGFAWARVREGLWRMYPIYATYPANKPYFTTYDYMNEANTAMWQWSEYNEGIVNSQTFITQSFAEIRATEIKDDQEPYATLKLNVPAAGLYTLDVNVTVGNCNLYFYMIPARELQDVNRNTLLADKYCVGAPINTVKETTIKYNGCFEAKEAGEYYFVVKMDSDNLKAGDEIPASWFARIYSISLTPDEYTGISIFSPVDEIEIGWNADVEVKGVWAAGGLDEFENPSKHFVFTSSDNKVATVDANGRIYGVGKGKVTITGKEVTTGNTATLTLEVKEKGQCKQDVYIYFSKASSTYLDEVTIEKDGWEFNFDKSSLSAAKGQVFNYGLYTTNRNIYNNTAIDVYVPHDGYYRFDFTGVHRQNNTGRADIYIDGVYVGDYIFNGKTDQVSILERLRTVYLTTGVHTFNFIPREESGQTSANYNYITIREFGLISVDSMPTITNVDAKEIFMAPGTSSLANIGITTSDGFTFSTAVPNEYPLDPAESITPYLDKYIKVTYKVISGGDVVTATASGQIVAIKEGQAMLCATISYLDEKGNEIANKSVDVPITVSASGEDPRSYQLSKIEIVGSFYKELGAYIQPVFKLSVDRTGSYYIRGINALGEEMNLADAIYRWEVSDTSVLKPTYTEDSSLTVTALKVGTCQITVTVTMDGRSASTFFEVTTREGKTGRSIYTDEMINNARANILKYDWAYEIRDGAVGNAEKYRMYELEDMWKYIMGQGVPRSYNTSYDNDPEMYYCRYCKSNLYTYYGNYPYKVDPYNNLWKITCPECDHSFPSNDFGSFYELGCTVENHHKFDRLTALENHRNMLKNKGLLSAESLALSGPGDKDGSEQWKLYYGYGVKGGYLYNETCRGVGTEADSKAVLSAWETVDGWGVDDGMGYHTGRYWENGTEEVYTFVAYYNHFATWFGTGNVAFVDGISACAFAYLYTGDERYGIIGAVLLDRVADIYPDLTLEGYEKFPNNDGGTNTGRALGRIWECLLTINLAEAYDILYPLYDDPYVVDFLNERAHDWGYGDAKSSASKIRENIETGLLRELYVACKNNDLYGNFGLPQAVLMTAAAALDTYPDTQEIIDFAFQYAASDYRTYMTGGNINYQLIETLYRDGQSYESPYYNEMGISNFSDAAAVLERYISYEGVSIYENPKYLSLMTSFQTMTQIRRGTKSTGDSNHALTYNRYPGTTGLQEAFQYLKDNDSVRSSVVRIAQHLYYLSSGLTDGLHYDIFTADPENYALDLKAFIDEYGEYDYDKSSILTGYGFAYLRDGTLHALGTTDGLRDTTRDFTLNFSGHYGHNHADLLDLGIEAYGLGMTTDLGYPETPAGSDPHTEQWSATTIAHNTIVVDEMSQRNSSYVGIPLHFDALDYRVKVMDASAPDAYSVCDDYRRTVVMIDFNDDISYGIDFFRVVGGDDHLYTFMPASEERPMVSENIKDAFVKQEGGSYAGEDVEVGNDPNTGIYNLYEYPLGYTWMYDVEKALDSGEKEFWLDYQIKDFRDQSRNDSEDGSFKMDIRMRITMLNNFDADEISLVSTIPQRINNNKVFDHLEQFMVRRTGTELDSLFTTVYEPYQEGQRYISEIDSALLEVKVADGVPAATDCVKAVRVKIDDGEGTVRYDYIIYASNKNVTYTLTDPECGTSFSFRGFIGVWSTNEEGENIYTYVNDGDYIGNAATVECSYTNSAITGKITDWQEELADDNWLDVTFDAPITEAEAKALADRLVNVERHEPGNSAFFIEGVTYEVNADGMVTSARLDIGTVTTISGYVDPKDISKGYKYDVFYGATFSIGMSYEGGAMADYSALNAELAFYESQNSADYTVDSWLRYQIVVERVQGISKTLRAIDQKIIDDAVESLVAAREGLVLKKKPVVQEEPDNNTWLLVLSGALGAAAVALGTVTVLLIVKKRKKAINQANAEETVDTPQ